MVNKDGKLISIHKALAGLDFTISDVSWTFDKISIHKALAGLDTGKGVASFGVPDFNPQGPRGPRLRKDTTWNFGW